jgi:hypothetical protein
MNPGTSLPFLLAICLCIFTLRPATCGIFTDMQGLSLQFRLAYNNYRTDYNFVAYREIHGYDIESVTEDFWDVRFYLDYRF